MAQKIERPKQSRCLGHVYRIRWRAPGSMKSDAGDAICGLTDTDKCFIDIEEGQPPSRERETLIHEVIHQLADGLNLPDDMEEMLASQLGLRLGAHMQENPLFWRYVTRRIPNGRS